MLSQAIVRNADDQLEYVLNAMIAASEIDEEGEVRFTRAFFLVRHQDDARVARVNRLAEIVVDWMQQALAETPP